MRKIVTTMIGCLFLSSMAGADIRLGDYRKAKAIAGTQWEFMKTYFLGAGNAYQWVNVQVPSLRKSPLFCPPEQMILQEQNYLDILDAEILRRQPKDDSYIDPLLLMGLEFTFPCNHQS
jgi:hypothetical protein